MILIIGYGNPLRSDDAIGQQLAHAVQRRLNRADVQAQTAHQLTPELVDSIRHAQLVIFIDARVGNRPGEVSHAVVDSVSPLGAMTHHVSPASLLAASKQLYDALPVGILITIVGASFELGTELSPQLRQALPSITDTVQQIIETSARVHIHEENNHA